MTRRLFTAALAGLVLACTPEKEQPASSASAPEPETADLSADRVRLETREGPIVIALNREKAPVTVANFLSYVSKGHYDGTVFHRVIGGFMIQGGGFVPEGSRLTEKPTAAPIRNEARNGLKNRRGTIAMARTADPDSATAQFFINLKDNLGLDYPNPDRHGYAVFGEVVEGMDVVDRIAGVATGSRPLAMIHPATGQLTTSEAGDVPLKDLVIRSAEAVTRD